MRIDTGFFIILFLTLLLSIPAEAKVKKVKKHQVQSQSIVKQIQTKKSGNKVVKKQRQTTVVVGKNKKGVVHKRKEVAEIAKALQASHISKTKKLHGSSKKAVKKVVLAKKTSAKKGVNKKKLASWCKKVAHPKAKDSDISNIVNHVFQKKNPVLLVSIIKTESSFLRTAVSHKNAFGLMQIRPCVWLPELKKEFPGTIKTRRDLFKIKANIDAGEFILNKYIAESGSLTKALVRYSGGSRDYAKKVLKTYYETKPKVVGHSTEDELKALITTLIISTKPSG